MTRRIPSDAFEYYAGLGPGRSYRAVADKFGVTKRAVTKFASRDGWRERLDRIEQDVREKSDQKLVDVLGETRDRHLKTVRFMQARALTALKQYPLSSGMEAMRAAELAIKLERLIVGEPSERTEMNIEEITKRELEHWLVPPGGEEDGADVDQEEE